MTEIISQIGSVFTISHLMTAVYVVNFLIALTLIFVDHSKPATSVLAWIMILYLIPIVGLVLYAIFSQNIARQQIFKLTSDEEKSFDTMLNWQKDNVRTALKESNEPAIRKWADMIEMNLDYADSLLTDNESVELIYDGKEMFERLCSDIRNAKYSIKVCYYIIKDDEVGMELLNLLTEKAKEGVNVRLLMDALGCRSIGRKELKKFTAAGGHYAFFFKPRIRNINFRINYRNHRKIVIIDSELGYIGGFNIAREYLGLKKKFGYWRDTQMIIKGNALTTLNARFYQDWRYAAKEELSLFDKSGRHAYKPDAGDIPIQIISCGPESDKDEIKRAMIKMINAAEKSIYIQTPYLVPDLPMLEAIGMAARSGVDVRIMIPCMPDHPFVYRTTLYNAGKLIEEGARIFIYENGFLHAKTLTVDGEVCTVGSCNFDNRSFKLNFESNAFVYDDATTRRMDIQFGKDMELCREYTSEDRAHIGAYEYAAESISRLLTEIL